MATEHVIKEMLPWIVAAMLGLGGGAGGVSWLDTTGAKAWAAEQQAEIAKNAELQRKVIMLESQNGMLLRLLEGATIRDEYLGPGETPP